MRAQRRLEVLLDEQDRQVPGGSRACELCDNVLDDRRLYAVARLIQQDQAGPARKTPRQRQDSGARPRRAA